MGDESGGGGGGGQQRRRRQCLAVKLVMLADEVGRGGCWLSCTAPTLHPTCLQQPTADAPGVQCGVHRQI